MKSYVNKMSWICFLLWGLACSSTSGNQATGGSEFGNPSRSLVGTVISQQANLGVVIKNQQVATCPVDLLTVTDAAGQSSQTDIDDACSFRAPVTPNKSYMVSFSQEGQFVATLIFPRSEGGLESSVFFVSEGDGDIDLDAVVIVGSQARPGRNPLTQNDRDGNGVSDWDDDDDDGDGIGDDDEEDCDWDGFWNDDDSDCEEDEDSDQEDDNENDENSQDDNGGDDDSDSPGDSDDSDDDSEDSEDDEDSQSSGRIRDVWPEALSQYAELDEEVMIEADCSLDEESVNATTFVVTGPLGAIACEYDLSESSTVVECAHEEALFAAFEEYTIVINGLRCQGGAPVESVTWTFETSDELDDGDDDDEEED